MSRIRPVSALLIFVLVVTGAGIATGAVAPGHVDSGDRAHSALPDGFRPAVLSSQDGLDRYIVRMESTAVAGVERIAGEKLSAVAEERAAATARASQAGAIAQAKSLGGDIVYRYDTLVNGFSVAVDAAGADALAARGDVRSVEPVSIVTRENETSVPFIGATDVWDIGGINHTRGQGVTVAVVDTGIDYTHANFGGPGTVQAYEDNDPTIIEPGTFPTAKVVGGYDLVGETYDVLDADTTNDTPEPDPDPLDDGDVGDHGSHTAGTCCGIGVSGEIGPGVAPRAHVLAIKVWHEGNSTDDVLVAGYERAMDPNDDGDTSDGADVISFSGGVDYGTEHSTEAVAAQAVVDLGTTFVASAGNSGNQPVGGSAYITGTPANAPGVISVAASIDEFNAQTITINSPPITLPDDPIMVQQDWGADLPSGGLTDDLFDGRELDPPASPGAETPADAQFCAPLPAGSLTGETVLVFKGATGAGDCAGSDKVANAAAAGAQAVVMISLFGGAPSALAGTPQPIPAVMISGPNGYAILDELSPDNVYNSGAVNATLNDATSAIPSYVDAMTDFTSEGPARVSNALKPDISAPGFDIQSTDAGTGNLGQKLSGTSMAAPHISGVAALLTQLHPSWSPQMIKSALMSQATQDMKDNLLGEPVSATVMGSGRVQALESANATTLTDPASLSYGLKFASDATNEVKTFQVSNRDSADHHYVVSGGDSRYSDFGVSPAGTRVSLDGSSFGPQRSFDLPAGQSQTVHVRLQLDPTAISEAEQEDGWYYIHPNVDGNITIDQSDNGDPDTLHVPWHVAPLAASNTGLSKSALDTSGGGDQMEVTGSGAGVEAADLYQLGATDPADSGGEEDVTAIGARSFTGDDVEDDDAEGLPAGSDAFAGISWTDFLADPDAPAEPVEFGVNTAAVHNTTETLEVDVLVDAGADGIYAGDDDGVPADYLVAKLAAPGGEVCVFDLSQPDPFDECTVTYFADYSNYNANNTGLVVSAEDIGITNASPEIAYQVTACTGRFAGDVPASICDAAGGETSGVYDARLNAADPALDIDPISCGGFFGGSSCRGADAISVSRGSAADGVDPSVLALFPNNDPASSSAVVTTDSTPETKPPPPPPPPGPDTTPPDTKIEKAPDKKITSSRAKFKFSSSESDSAFECRLDDGDFKSCESPKTFKHLDAGKHKFRVRAVDAAGNVDPSPARYKFKVVAED
jgi:minor extracellular serine protease Vpr